MSPTEAARGAILGSARSAPSHSTPKAPSVNQPMVQIAVPAFSRSMKTLAVVFGVVWLLEALLGRSGGNPDPMGPFAALVLVPSRVAHGQVWRVFTHPFVHDPAGIASVLWTAASLWFFGGPLEARWGTKRLFVAMGVASLAAALVVIAVGALYLPFWTRAVYSPAAATALLAGAWGMSEGSRPMSLLGLVTLTGRQFTALLGVILVLQFFWQRSPETVLALVGALVGVVLGNVPPAAPPRARRDSGPKLRVIKGGVDPRDLPN